MSEHRDPHRVNSLVLTPDADPTRGSIRWDPAHSLWNGGMMLAALTLAPRTASVNAVLVFLGLAALTLCAGHSVGFHRQIDLGYRFILRARSLMSPFLVSWWSTFLLCAPRGLGDGVEDHH